MFLVPDEPLPKAAFARLTRLCFNGGHGVRTMALILGVPLGFIQDVSFFISKNYAVIFCVHDIIW